MTREESLAFLRSCLDKIKNASEEEIQFYKETYKKECGHPVWNTNFEFTPPVDPDYNEFNL